MENYSIEQSWRMMSDRTGQYEVHIYFQMKEVVNFKFKEEDIDHDEIKHFYINLKDSINDSVLKIGKYKFNYFKDNEIVEIERGMKVILSINDELIEFFRVIIFNTTRDIDYYMDGDIDFDSNDLFGF